MTEHELNPPVPRHQAALSESELQQMKDKQILEFIREAVDELRRLGDRMERFAASHIPDGGSR